jgi:hypothetical protein
VVVSHVSPIRPRAWALGVDVSISWRTHLHPASITHVGVGRFSRSCARSTSPAISHHRVTQVIPAPTASRDNRARSPGVGAVRFRATVPHPDASMPEPSRPTTCRLPRCHPSPRQRPSSRRRSLTGAVWPPRRCLASGSGRCTTRRASAPGG